MDNLEEMDKFLEKYNLPKLSQRRANTYPTQTVSENCGGRETPQLILQGHNQCDTKIKDTAKREKITG